MQKNHGYYTTSIRYYANDPIPSDEYFLMPHIDSQVSHAPGNVRTPHYGLTGDSMYGLDKYPEDHHQKNFHMRNRHQDKGHHGVLPEVHKKVHFVEHVEIDRKGKHEVHDEDISVDAEADGFIQKKHQTFDKWETVKEY
ncbi:hypothetical protein F511_00652 [Dorcoceras hygrometricum]|nr:hypothetical protein F511_00652 [Dorcoceras hygrometricum]